LGTLPTGLTTGNYFAYKVMWHIIRFF
jgi:hypothetical protein